RPTRSRDQRASHTGCRACTWPTVRRCQGLCRWIHHSRSWAWHVTSRQDCMRDMVVRGRRRSGGAVLATTLVLAACVMPGGMSIPTGTRAPGSGAGTSLTTVARGVVEEANRARRGQDLDALIEDAALNRAAREHS